MILVGDRRADIEFFNTGHEDNVTGLSFVDFLAFKPFELKNLIDQVEQPEGTQVDDRKFLRLSGRQ